MSVEREDKRDSCLVVVIDVERFVSGKRVAVLAAGRCWCNREDLVAVDAAAVGAAPVAVGDSEVAAVAARTVESVAIRTQAPASSVLASTMLPSASRVNRTFLFGASNVMFTSGADCSGTFTVTGASTCTGVGSTFTVTLGGN